jgi:hypothetical protein
MPPQIAELGMGDCRLCGGRIKPGETVWKCGDGYAHDLCVSMDPEDIEPAG